MTNKTTPIAEGNIGDALKAEIVAAGLSGGRLVTFHDKNGRARLDHALNVRGEEVPVPRGLAESLLLAAQKGVEVSDGAVFHVPDYGRPPEPHPMRGKPRPQRSDYAHREVDFFKDVTTWERVNNGDLGAQG